MTVNYVFIWSELMRYYISDLHFFHKNLNHSMDNRGFSSEEEMNEYMINQWNSRVRHGDEVVVLGDFSLGNGEQTNGILQRLKGRKYLVEGNHDHNFLKDKKFNQNLFKWIKPYAELNDDRRKVILCHYPIMCYNGQYKRTEDDVPRTWMLYGHVHNTHDVDSVEAYINYVKTHHVLSVREKESRPAPCQMINCFCMNSDYVPLTLDEWISLRYTNN